MISGYISSLCVASVWPLLPVSGKAGHVSERNPEIPFGPARVGWHVVVTASASVCQWVVVLIVC